jgi:hypothetical protein
VSKSSDDWREDQRKDAEQWRRDWERDKLGVVVIDRPTHQQSEEEESDERVKA